MLRLRARRRRQVEQPRLHRDDVLQALDVPSRDREHPDLDAPLERIGREPRPPTGKTQRVQQRAGQDRVGQRVGRRLEARAVAIERARSSCHSASGAAASSGVISFISFVARSCRIASSAWPDRRIL